MTAKPLLQLFVFVLAVNAFYAYAAFSYNDVKQLPDFPESYYQLDSNGQIEWLKSRLDESPHEVIEYQLTRALVAQYVRQELLDKVAQHCIDVPPQELDFHYRTQCTEPFYGDYDKYIEAMVDIVQDANNSGQFEIAANNMASIGWRQSQAGYVTAALESFEMALSMAKDLDQDALDVIMFNTATVYIVNGDITYIKKGIDLLKEIKQHSLEVINRDPKNAPEPVKQNYILSSFNLGIAYMLHLNDNDNALIHFSDTFEYKTALSTEALSFAALAAAELGKHQQAKNYIAEHQDYKNGNIVKDTYLACYRELAIYHWDKTQSLSHCINLHPNTAVEVKLDLYERLIALNYQDVELITLRKLYKLFNEKLIPQLKSRGSKAASNTELNRLQRESELKTQFIEKERALKVAESDKRSTQQRLFIALFVILFMSILFVVLQLRQKQKLAQQFEEMSTRDPLTKLGNRRYLEQQIERELSLIKRDVIGGQKCALGIYIMDIDHFKQINDTYGHQLGDEVLIELSKRVNQTIRNTDLFIRWGGEEFVYIARIDSCERLSYLADRVTTAINSKPFKLSNNTEIEVTCTMGALTYPFIQNGPPPYVEIWSKLISLADAALYYGKRKKRNCWVVVNNISINEVEELEKLLTQPLEESLEQGKVSIYTSYD
ncbi:GGDEF domain-containing protein [Flocculibacter collagenilyticus]|uniref:GGDEF domain-containing protein n=1 Tax=Flocculibacter collagenilyticus TaxID=2744479 RepID=UPI0018F66661|nr:GGDEF domain-containing protein [Flocculibacter collagenilyticus]